MDKKKKFMIAGLAAAAVLVIIAAVIIGILIGRHTATTDWNITQESHGTAASDEKEQAGQTAQTTQTAAAPEKLDVSVRLKQSNSWEGNGRYFAQYDVVIENREPVKINEWTLNLMAVEDVKLEQSWNCAVSDNKDKWSITAADYNREVNASSKIDGIGFIVSFSSERELSLYNLDVVMENNTMVTVNKDGEVTDGKLTAANETEQNEDAAAKSSIADSQGGGNAGSDIADSQGDGNEGSDIADSQGNGNEESNDTDSQGSGAAGSGSGHVVANTTVPQGRLHVSGTNLVDASGSIVQLRGVSTHGIAWFPQYVNYEAFSTLKNDWDANVIRLAMYPAEYNGYLTGGNQETLRQVIYDGVDYATQLGMYVIIDWHVLNYNPAQYTSEAKEFFAEMASRYAGYENVIYEICNEPVGADWNSQIKPYAEEIIAAIRQYDANAVIIVGTNTWSQDVDAVIGNQLSDNNVMYALHFYAATHKDNIRNKLITAVDAGVPVFVSECSICDASGAGGIDYDSANKWLDLLNRRNISFIAWSLCNKQETSALISSGCGATGGWSDGDLSDTGRWFKSAIKGQ